MASSLRNQVLCEENREMFMRVSSIYALSYSIGSIGVWIALVTVWAFVWELRNGYSTQHAMTVFFATLILSRLFNGLNCRSMEDSIVKLGLFTNRSLILSIMISLFLYILSDLCSFFARSIWD